MRLILENEFTWDGTYAIVDEDGSALYTVEASFSEETKRVKLFACTPEELSRHYEIIDSEPETDEEKFKVATEKLDRKYDIAALMYEKRQLSKAVYTVEIGRKTIATIERGYKATADDYGVEIKDMMLSGRVYDWDFIIVNKKEVVARSGVSGNRLCFEYENEDYELCLAILLAATAGLAYDLRTASMQTAEGKKVSEREPVHVPSFMRGSAQGSGLEEAISMLRNGAEKAGEFGQKVAEAGGKARIAGKKTARTAKKLADSGKKSLEKGEKVIEKIFLSEENRAMLEQQEKERAAEQEKPEK